MSDAEDGPAERGRYALFVTPDGPVIGRAIILVVVDYGLKRAIVEAARGGQQRAGAGAAGGNAGAVGARNRGDGVGADPGVGADDAGPVGEGEAARVAEPHRAARRAPRDGKRAGGA